MRNLVKELLELKPHGELIPDTGFSKVVYPPISNDELVSAEKFLGFPLTPSLRQIYLEVANGGFGPAYGLLGLTGGMTNEDGNDAIMQYKDYRQCDPADPHWRWPEGLLPVGHLGCAMYLCVDCTKRDGPVIWFEPAAHEDGKPWQDSFFPFVESTEEWLFAWIDGNDLFKKVSAEVYRVLKNDE